MIEGRACTVASVKSAFKKHGIVADEQVVAKLVVTAKKHGELITVVVNSWIADILNDYILITKGR
ncbi:MAG: hypothetical protein FWF56_03605 [Firmicutes bacterium]|nr:hypothetical protein [Bacillota bacterium]